MGYGGDEEDKRRIVRCARCDAMVFPELAGSGHADASTVCDLCGMKMPDLPVVDSDYFSVAMRAGRPLGGRRRLRRAEE